MKMIGHQRPAITSGLSFDHDVTQPLQETVSIAVVYKYFALLISTGNDMVQGIGSIDTRSAWHVIVIIRDTIALQVYKLGTSPRNTGRPPLLLYQPFHRPKDSLRQTGPWLE